MDRRSFLKISAGLSMCPLCATAARAAGPHWGYDGDEGPEHWSDLSEDFRACATGTRQSPIDLTRPLRADLPPLEFRYTSGFARVVNNGHTVQADATAGNQLVAGEQVYNLVQFHFHHPSEHFLEGKSFPLECHFVHRSSSGDYGVVGVLLERGEANAAFGAVLDQLQQPRGTALASSFDVMGLLPEEKHYVSYVGSFTTPPCSEGVDWMVLTTPVSVSDEQISRFAALYANNARPLQPRNHRFLLGL